MPGRAGRYTRGLKRFVLLAAVIACLTGCTPQMFIGGVFAVVSEHENKKPAELDPNRPVREQDCRKPIEDSGGNLRCK